MVCGSGPPREAGLALWRPLARVIVAMRRVSWRLCLAPALLALELRQFPVDRAQTPLTGDVRPPTHHEGALRTMGPLLATSGVLQIGEPSMGGVSHGGSPLPRSGPHGCGPLTDLPSTLLPWAAPRGRPPVYPTGVRARGDPRTRRGATPAGRAGAGGRLAHPP